MAKRYISAGAGSGKTYRITTEVANLIKNGKLKPNQVIMTTFTKAAAQELREKSKKELANIGRYQEAQEMEQALIGTVHSVANVFLSKYWYLLGILPDATVMEEEDVQIYRKHSLRDLLSLEERSFLMRFAQTYNVQYPYYEHKSGINYEFWIKDLDSVLNFVQWNDLKEHELAEKGLSITKSLIASLVSEGDVQQEAQLYLTESEKVLNEMRRGSAHQRQQLQIIASCKGRTLSTEELEMLLENPHNNCRALDSYKKFFISFTFSEEKKKDLVDYARLILDLAVRWRSKYRSYKDKHRLIDFNDMEQFFLQLLDSPEVQEDIQSHYTHLFVDEFQDSNPVQVRIFEKLSSLLLEACYVGDKKQAIYGFRGSDTELTRSVEDSIGNKETLPYSYRSVKPLVDFSNAIFEKIFKDTIAKEEIVLRMPEEGGNDALPEKPLRLWPYNGNETLARQIQQLILREKINPKDIAVLARKNYELDPLAEELRKCKVPVCRESNDLRESRTGRLLKALLTLVETPDNPLGRAELAYLTEPGYNVTRIIETRLKDSSNHYLEDDLPLLKRFLSLKETFSNQSISSLVESLIIELDLYALVQQWENAQAEETNLQEFIDLARKYEDYATKWAKPATVSGFILYFSEHQQRGAANEEGVRLYTYHKAKGLEWKVVILLSLGNDVSDPYRLASRSMLGCHFHGDLGVSLVRNIYGESDLVKKYLASRLQTHPLWEKVKTREIREAARLLYVGVTRAKEILILAPNVNRNNVRLDWFHSVGLTDITQEINGKESQDFFGINAPLRIEKTEDLKDLLQWPEPEQKKVHDIAVEYSPLELKRDISPSHARSSLRYEIVPINDQEDRMTIHQKAEDEALIGDMIHQVFCCCDDRIDLDKILRLREDYGLAPEVMPEPERLLASWNYLVSMLESRYGKSVKRHHERPFRHLDDNGHIVSGFIDLVWETADAFVIVDYKTCPGNYKQVFDEVSEHYAGRHGKQLDFYQHALEAEKSKRVLARVIYYPVTRFMVEVK